MVAWTYAPRLTALAMVQPDAAGDIPSWPVSWYGVARPRALSGLAGTMISQFTFAGGSAAGAALPEALGQGDAVPDAGAGSDGGAVPDDVAGSEDVAGSDEGAVPDVAGSDDGAVPDVAGSDEGAVPDDVAGSDDGAVPDVPGSDEGAVPDDVAGSDDDVPAGGSAETAAAGLAAGASHEPRADWVTRVVLLPETAMMIPSVTPRAIGMARGTAMRTARLLCLRRRHPDRCPLSIESTSKDVPCNAPGGSP
jgi:hypothetical protein